MASTACNILTFKIPVNGKAYAGTISGNGNIMVKVPYGTSLASLAPVIEISTGATVSPASAATTDFSAGPVTYTVTAEDGTTTKVYKATVTVMPDATVLGVYTSRIPGWSNTRSVIGNLGNYVAGGITLNLGNFKPKGVIGLQVDKGNVGYFDLNTMTLKVYKSAGVEATADVSVEFSVVLMGE